MSFPRAWYAQEHIAQDAQVRLEDDTCQHCLPPQLLCDPSQLPGEGKHLPRLDRKFRGEPPDLLRPVLRRRL